MEKLVFSAGNGHVGYCGEPPEIVKGGAGYYGYFENNYGEQAVFHYDRETKEGRLQMGDCGWDKVYNVVDGFVEDLTLDHEEQLWLVACWAAATSQRIEVVLARQTALATARSKVMLSKLTPAQAESAVQIAENSHESDAG